jgi:hypothetical protein
MKIRHPTTPLVRGEIFYWTIAALGGTAKKFGKNLPKKLAKKKRNSTSWRCLGLQQQLLDISLVA